MIAMAYIRDQITVDNAFASDLAAEMAAHKVAPGATVLIAARSIKHAKDYVLSMSGYHVILAADQYDCAGGAIDVSGSPGATGDKGTPPGANGYASAASAGNRPGGRGADGGQGGPGAPGMQITVLCAELVNARLLSRGGPGGVGGAGAPGGAGGAGFKIVAGPGGSKHKEPVGTSGGDGGAGGKGNNGGNGGIVKVVYVKANAAPVTAVTAGAAGPGGAPGAGGKGGPGSSDGKAGGKGPNGMRGADGQVSTQQIARAALPAVLRQELGNFAHAWSEYRTRTGEFLFRTASGKSATRRASLALAVVELRAAVQLSANHAKAATMLGSIQHRMTPLGIPRDYYLTPSFEQYEDAFTDYAPLIQELSSAGKDILLHASSVQQNRDRIGAQIAHMRAQQSIADSEMAEALLEKSGSPRGLVGGSRPVVHGIEVNTCAAELE